MKDSGEEIKNRSTAAFLAIAIHGLLFLLLYFFVIKTPIPPFPESGSAGLEVNFGTSETGSGMQQTSTLEEEITTTPEPSGQAAEEEPIITADNGEETTVKEPPKKKPKKKKESKSIQEETKSPAENNNNNPKKEVTKVEPEPPKALALYGGKKKNSKGSDGNTGGTGDQGDPNGNPDVKIYGRRTGRGTGGDGEGNGDGPGKGEGNGQGPGKPVSFSLAGRKASNLPVPRDRFDEAGRVVVEIFVDKQGIVKRAKAGVKGSTTSNPNLLEIARKAALKSVFSVSDDAPEEQRGTIIYNFILN